MATQLQPIPRSQATSTVVSARKSHIRTWEAITRSQCPSFCTAGDYHAAVRSRPLPSDVEAGPRKFWRAEARKRSGTPV